MDKIIAVIGPTASGKSDLAVRLAKEIGGEIISCDSMQVYKGMDIGTGKITEAEMDGVLHHLIDIHEIDEPYDVAEFQTLCREKISEIQKRNHIPVLCGGTGLYLKAAVYDYTFSQEETDPKRAALLEKMSNEELVSLLEKEDPRALKTIHPNNRKRLLRAALLAGNETTKSRQEAAQNHEPVYDLYMIGLFTDKALVDQRIEKRVRSMFEAGLAREAADLFGNPETWSFNSFSAIGYKEFKPYFLKEAGLDEVENQIVIHSRQYAKRQMTWFRNQFDVHWYRLDETERAIREGAEWLGQK